MQPSSAVFLETKPGEQTWKAALLPAEPVDPCGAVPYSILLCCHPDVCSNATTPVLSPFLSCHPCVALVAHTYWSAHLFRRCRPLTLDQALLWVPVTHKNRTAPLPPAPALGNVCGDRR